MPRPRQVTVPASEIATDDGVLSPLTRRVALAIRSEPTGPMSSRWRQAGAGVRRLRTAEIEQQAAQQTPLPSPGAEEPEPPAAPAPAKNGPVATAMAVLEPHCRKLAAAASMLESFAASLRHLTLADIVGAASKLRRVVSSLDKIAAEVAKDCEREFLRLYRRGEQQAQQQLSQEQALTTTRDAPTPTDRNQAAAARHTLHTILLSCTRIIGADACTMHVKQYGFRVDGEASLEATACVVMSGLPPQNLRGPSRLAQAVCRTGIAANVVDPHSEMRPNAGGQGAGSAALLCVPLPQGRGVITLQRDKNAASAHYRSCCGFHPRDEAVVFAAAELCQQIMSDYAGCDIGGEDASAASAAFASRQPPTHPVTPQQSQSRRAQHVYRSEHGTAAWFSHAERAQRLGTAGVADLLDEVHGAQQTLQRVIDDQQRRLSAAELRASELSLRLSDALKGYSEAQRHVALLHGASVMHKRDQLQAQADAQAVSALEERSGGRMLPSAGGSPISMPLSIRTPQDSQEAGVGNSARPQLDTGDSRCYAYMKSELDTAVAVGELSEADGKNLLTPPPPAPSCIASQAPPQQQPQFLISSPAKRYKHFLFAPSVGSPRRRTEVSGSPRAVIAGITPKPPRARSGGIRRQGEQVWNGRCSTARPPKQFRRSNFGFF
eukprot:TRINITY_DN43838_c0_g1_i1.p1 TRINITY_DN43838_c0_g1~~TRINITY_DN43838_c0_g1_i1.p1  ORF type:complete len:684 (+),score=174.30 TRINITY_DN43838_c0_g1_i1:66-2054(+)